jgi:hypothetical protein
LLACARSAAVIVGSEDSADVVDVFCRDVGKIVVALPATAISFDLICH